MEWNGTCVLVCVVTVVTRNTCKRTTITVITPHREHNKHSHSFSLSDTHTHTHSSSGQNQNVSIQAQLKITNRKK